MRVSIGVMMHQGSIVWGASCGSELLHALKLCLSCCYVTPRATPLLKCTRDLSCGIQHEKDLGDLSVSHLVNFGPLSERIGNEKKAFLLQCAQKMDFSARLRELCPECIEVAVIEYKDRFCACQELGIYHG